MSLLAFIFLSAVALRLEAVMAVGDAAPDHPLPGLADADLPAYTIVAPLYREANVAAQLVEALLRVDYPAAKLDIKLVVESDDAPTITALAAIALPPFAQVLVVPPGAPRTKPRALNFALPFASGELIVVFDAEDRPEPGQLRKAAAIFASGPGDLACLQARLSIDNSADSWLTRLFALEYGALFDVVNPGFGILGLPFPLGGTSNHFRTARLREIAGWDAWNVTEDADLGIRLARAGLRVDTFASTTHEEAPAKVGAWLDQRRRWFKGWMQTLVVHARHPAALVSELGFARAGAVLVTLVSTVASSLTPLA